MARYNEILVARYNRALQKLLGMKGEPPAPQLASEIQPSLLFGAGVENRFVESWNRFAQATVTAAAAANQSAVRLRNPGGSNVIAVIEKMTHAFTVADQGFVAHGQALVDLANNFNAATAFDSRQAGAAVLRYSSQNTTPSVPGLQNQGILCIAHAAAAATVDYIFTEDQQIVLLPGDALQMVENTVNVAMETTFWWRERFLEEGERA